MITDNQLFAISEALRLSNYETIKQGVLVALADNPAFTASQKIAVRLAAEKLPSWPGSDIMRGDGVLLGIMEITWPDIGVPDTDADALVPEQRVGIIDAVMGVCRGIIEAERARLLALVELDTDFPVEEPEE